MNRAAIWAAYRLMVATHEPPSARLLDDTFDECARWDFDQAVRLFGDSVESLLRETKQVPDSEPPPKRARRTKTVAVWTLAQLLGLDDEDGEAADVGFEVMEPFDPAMLDWWAGED